MFKSLRSFTVFSLLVLLIVFSLAGSANATHEDAVVADWLFDEGSGTTTVDSSANGNDGTLGNSPNWVTGKFFGALEFDGAERYVQVSDSATLNPSSITIESWVYPTNLSGHRVIVNKADFANIDYDLRLVNGYPRFAYDGDWNDEVYVTASTPVVANQWSHVVAVKKYGQVQFYINGVLVGSPWLWDNLRNSSGNLRIGTRAYNVYPYTGSPFVGTIDNTRIYNRNLTAAEVTERYNVIPPPPTDPNPGDSLYPITTITTNPNRPDAYDGIYKTLPTITLTHNKTEGDTYYKWDDSPDWVTYTTPIAFPPAFDKPTDASGEHTLYFYSEAYGKTEETRFFDFKVDSSYVMPSVMGGTCDTCHGVGSTLVGGDHLTWYQGTPHDTALNNDGTDGYPAVLPVGSSTRCQRCHYDAMTPDGNGNPISARFLRVTGANPAEPDGVRDPAGIIHEVLDNDNTLCYACHTGGAGAFTGKVTFEKTKHAKNSGFASTKALTRWPDVSFGQGMCGNCHNPHGVEGTTDYRRKNKNELCTTCHDRQPAPAQKVLKEGTYLSSQTGDSGPLFTEERVFTQQGMTSRYPYTSVAIERVTELGATSDSYLGSQDGFTQSNLLLQISKDVYLPNNTTMGIYLNKEPTLTGATLIDSWPDPLIILGTREKNLDITSWLNNNKNEELFVIYTIPADSYGPGNSVSSSISADIASLYVDSDPSDASDFYAYQGKTKYDSSAHGSTTNPVNVATGQETGASIGTGGATPGECINCHNPHGKEDGGGNLMTKLLMGDEEDSCYTCHDKTSTSVGGINIKERFTASSSVWARHGVTKAEQDVSFRKLECTSCHNPHLNNAQNKVIDPDNKTQLYTQTMTDPATGTQVADTVGFCLKCHDQSTYLLGELRPPWFRLYQIGTTAPNYEAIWSVPSIPYASNFHGDKAAVGEFQSPSRPALFNIERERDYGGLVKPYTRNMSAIPCATCHDEHGSSQLMHIKEIVNGKPVNIAGGSNMLSLCEACHKRRGISQAHILNCQGTACHPEALPGPGMTLEVMNNYPNAPASDCNKCHNHPNFSWSHGMPSPGL